MAFTSFHAPKGEHSHRTLHAVIVCSNPVRFQSRYRLHKEFMERMEHSAKLSESRLQAKLNLIVVEVAFGNRAFEVTDSANPNHVQLRTQDELWHKENMVNLGVQRLTQLHPDWQHMAWIDADIEFQRPDWIQETVHQLQHYQVVQMWEDAIDLGPHHQTIQTHKSFMSQYAKGTKRRDGEGKLYSPHWHPGFAWAMNRSAWDALGGLIDIAILGAGDNHMALGLVSAMRESLAPGISNEYALELLTWEQRAIHHIKGDVGYVPGTLLHHWHGKKKDRQYWDRWKILTGNQYAPRTDIKRDAQGLYQLESITHRQIQLRDQIRKYFRARHEDSIDLE